MTDYSNIICNGYRFVNHVEDKVVQSTFDFTKIYAENTCHQHLHNLMNYGYIKVMGYLYSFSDSVLQRYIVKTDYYLAEYYAPTEKMLRAVLDIETYGKIYYIKEI